VVIGPRRIWCETLPYADVRSARVLGLLERFGLELLLAVRPWDIPELPDVLRACADRGIAVGLWPMLENEEGRWASIHNAQRFADLARRVADHAPRSLTIDLEPPFDRVRALTQGKVPLRSLRGWLCAGDGAFDAGRAVFEELARDLASRGIESVGVFVPLVLFDRDGGTTWQRFFGTPVTGVGWSRVDVMLYTSLIEGWSRGLVRREDALAFLHAGAAATRRRFGPDASVSLGTVGTGALGNEPMYRDVGELREDIAVARAAGIENLTLFDLAGVVRRHLPESWLEAFVDPSSPAPPRHPRRVRAVVSALRTVSRARTT
jgi:hypothetical protein